jgi:hypothetical protein
MRVKTQKLILANLLQAEISLSTCFAFLTPDHNLPSAEPDFFGMVSHPPRDPAEQAAGHEGLPEKGHDLAAIAQDGRDRGTGTVSLRGRPHPQAA